MDLSIYFHDKYHLTLLLWLTVLTFMYMQKSEKLELFSRALESYFLLLLFVVPYVKNVLILFIQIFIINTNLYLYEYCHVTAKTCTVVPLFFYPHNLVAILLSQARKNLSSKRSKCSYVWEGALILHYFYLEESRVSSACLKKLTCLV